MRNSLHERADAGAGAGAFGLVTDSDWGEELVERETCPTCGTSWRVGRPPAGSWCESIDLDCIVAWVCVRCGSWWRVRTSTLDQLSPSGLAGHAGLDVEKLRGCITP